MPELRALERAMRKIEPELGTRRAPQLEKYWSQYNLDLAITSQGMTVVASDRMSLSVAACHSLHVLSVIPVVTLQIADKSARILADGCAAHRWRPTSGHCELELSVARSDCDRANDRPVRGCRGHRSL